MVMKNNEIKLIDFGLSKRSTRGKKLKTIAGTPYYMAPEVMNGENYNSKVDIWSLGVILYVFMSGYLPFQGENQAEVFEKITKGEPHFKHKEFRDCSQTVINLIKLMLQRDPKNRLSAADALKHDWFKESSTNPINIDQGVISRL